jgi:hypothetical protein
VIIAHCLPISGRVFAILNLNTTQPNSLTHHHQLYIYQIVKKRAIHSSNAAAT